MKGMFSRIAVAVTVCGVLAALLVPAATADTSAMPSSGPVLVVFNPSPGDMIPRSKQYLYGVAYDPAATTGSGITKIMVFAGDREKGGLWLGTAADAMTLASFPADVPSLISGKLNLPNPGAAPGSKWANTGWRIKTRTTLKKFMSGTFYFYALSGVTSKETVVQVANITIDPGRSSSGPF